MLSNVAVPSGVTLDLSDLNDGTTVSNTKMTKLDAQYNDTD